MDPVSLSVIVHVNSLINPKGYRPYAAFYGVVGGAAGGLGLRVCTALKLWNPSGSIPYFDLLKDPRWAAVLEASNDSKAEVCAKHTLRVPYFVQERVQCATGSSWGGVSTL